MTNNTEVFTHMVFFWMKEPDNQKHREQFEVSLNHFIDHSPYVISKHIGIPANTPRTVVDNSYTFNLVVTFKSKEDQDKYQAEKGHLEFIEKCEELWDRVQVYDSVKI